MDSTEVMTRTSGRQPSLLASNNIRPIRGSTGSRASLWPTPVSRGGLEAGLIAPNSSRSCTPAVIARLSGASRKAKSDTAPRRNEVICKITLAKEVLKISGSVNSGRPRKSSSEYKRMAMPGASRPHRPER